ncbi:hypothetical protein, partial [Fervidicella metallireducens]|uniref:hypothetical protein n=1 Tax=Fervidicella metallireducens TaxID=655338 RepID=UPI00055497A4
HNILDATSAENVVYAFTYDSFGNPLTSKIKDAAGTTVINSNATYTTDGNYIKEVEDSEGNKVSYSYNSTKGTLDKLTDANGSETNYVYDDLDRLTQVSKKESSAQDAKTITNSYGYEDDKIKTITHNGFSYSFGYDSFGNNTTVSVGTQKLIENTYNLVSGKLLYSTYGNGHKVSYDYDDLDRVTAEKYNDVVKFKYEYDGS